MWYKEYKVYQLRKLNLIENIKKELVKIIWSMTHFILVYYFNYYTLDVSW